MTMKNVTRTSVATPLRVNSKPVGKPTASAKYNNRLSSTPGRGRPRKQVDLPGSTPINKPRGRPASVNPIRTNSAKLIRVHNKPRSLGSSSSSSLVRPNQKVMVTSKPNLYNHRKIGCSVSTQTPPQG